MLTEQDFQNAEDLLRDPDAEDCERFASRYGRKLLRTARVAAELIAATQALGALPDGYCFCSSNRIGDDSKVHEPECRDLRAAITAEHASEEAYRLADELAVRGNV